MGAIQVHEFTTLDGVIDAPTWSAEFGFDPRMGGAIGAFVGRCTAILLGRTTYEMFEPVWSTRTVEDDPGAPFFNETTKYVVTGTLTDPTWRNSKVLGPYEPDAISSLKDEVGGDIYVSGSAMLARAMLEDGLVDELHLFVYPSGRAARGPGSSQRGRAPRRWSSPRASPTTTVSCTSPTALPPGEPPSVRMSAGMSASQVIDHIRRRREDGRLIVIDGGMGSELEARGR